MAEEKKKKDPLADYPEMKDSNDFYNFTGTDDDFERAKKKYKKNAKRKAVDLDKEVAKYKRQDARENALADAPKYSEKERKAQYKKYLGEKERTEMEISRKLQQELGAEYEITDEDANWTGLE